jgi:hypothetical protein
LKEGILWLVLQTTTHHGELLMVEGTVLSELLGCAPSEYLPILEAVLFRKCDCLSVWLDRL